MRHILAQHPAIVPAMPPAELRRNFLLTDLFVPGKINLTWWETDRTILGGICPAATPLVLLPDASMRSTSFLERREAGVLNLGGPGVVRVDGEEFALDRLDGLYLGRGAGPVEWLSVRAEQPAKFWFLSYPAHTAYPTRRVTRAEALGDEVGAAASANARVIHKYFHPGAFPTCQLVMGLTMLKPGSVWNTMPPHTHLRRSEVYLYCDLPTDQAVFHFMGQPTATRHLVVRNHEVVLSPPWSIHSGAGTSNYSFVWGMGGENQEFADMDAVSPNELF